MLGDSDWDWDGCYLRSQQQPFVADGWDFDAGNSEHHNYCSNAVVAAVVDAVVVD